MKTKPLVWFIINRKDTVIDRLKHAKEVIKDMISKKQRRLD
jgi:hypothetical protein